MRSSVTTIMVPVATYQFWKTECAEHSPMTSRRPPGPEKAGETPTLKQTEHRLGFIYMMSWQSAQALCLTRLGVNPSFAR